MLLVSTNLARVAAGCALALCASACAGNACHQVAVDCQSQIRFDGRVYTGFGWTQRSATRFAVADRAECHDTGTCPVGSVFPAHPAQVAVWSFDGYDTGMVVGVRSYGGSLQVLVAEWLPREDQDRILTELSRRQR